jgi:hypothetical protein
MADLSINVQQDSYRVSDFVLGAALGVALSAGVMEIGKLSDSVQAALLPPPSLSVQVATEGCRPIDRVYGATRYVQSQNALSAGLYEGHDKVSESLTVRRSLDTGLLQEVPRLSDQLSVLRSPSLIVLQETLKLDDFGQVDLYGLGARLKISDAVTVELLPLSERMRVLDQVAVNYSPIFTVIDSETVLLSEDGWVELSVEAEVLHLADAPTASIPFSGLSANPGDETVKVADSVATLISSINATPSETLFMYDSGLVELSVEAEILHLADTVAAAIAAGNLAATAGPETLKLADTATVLLNPEQTSTASESLKVADSVSGLTLDPEQTSTPAEALKVQDTVTAQIGGGAFVLETLKLADTVLGPTLNPEQTSGFDEALKVQDSVTSTLDPEQTSIQESLKLQETVSSNLDPEQTSTPAEALKVQDSVSVALWLAVQPSDELLHVQDFPTTNLSTSLSELLHVQDTVTASSGSNLVATSAESLKVQDTATIALDPELVTVTEGLKVSESVSAVLTTVIASVGEALSIADQPSVSLTPEQQSVSELLHVSDTVQVFLGIPPAASPDYRITARARPRVIIARSRSRVIA